MGSTRNSCRLLLDVGGTFLKSAVADAAGQLLSGSEFSCPIRSEGSREEIEGSLAATVARGAAFAAELFPVSFAARTSAPKGFSSVNPPAPPPRPAFANEGPRRLTARAVSASASSAADIMADSSEEQRQ